jgi:hypothetical protein
MEQYVIELKDKRKRNAFLKVLRDLDYVRLVEIFGDADKARSAREFLGSLRDIKAHQQGKLKLKSAKEALDEL